MHSACNDNCPLVLVHDKVLQEPCLDANLLVSLSRHLFTNLRPRLLLHMFNVQLSLLDKLGYLFFLVLFTHLVDGVFDHEPVSRFLLVIHRQHIKVSKVEVDVLCDGD